MCWGYDNHHLPLPGHPEGPHAEQPRGVKAGGLLSEPPNARGQGVCLWADTGTAGRAAASDAGAGDMAIAFTCPTNRVIDQMALGERVKPYIDALCPQYENINGERVMIVEGDIIDDSRQVIPNISLSATYRKGESGVIITLTPQ